MKKLLLGSAAFLLLSAGVASATDMPIKAPVYKAPEALYDWSGFYAGVYSGVGAQRSRSDDPTGHTENGVENTGSSFTGGATAGYNWQYNRNIVLGVEGDIGYLGLDHPITDYNDSLIYNSRTSWIGTLRARAGWSNGPTLNYVTAGGAWVGIKDSIVDTSVGGNAISSSKTLGGYTYGSGVETMLGGNWTAKAEYSVVDVGRGAFLGPTSGLTYTTQEKHRYETMKFGINYLFGGKPQPVLMAHNWTGFYAGGLAGSALTESRGNDPTGVTPGQIGNNGDGFTVGGLAGYNWQFAPQWVAGAEGDFSWLGIKHAEEDLADTGPLTVKTSWLGTLRGRIGYSTGPALLYVTGGAAWVHLQDRWAFPAPQVSSSLTKSGGTFGGGIETVLGGNWTSKTEYLYVDAGRGGTLASGGFNLQLDHTFHVFRSALVYKFGSQ